ncbi:MAG: hypothetical protein ACO1OT_12040 [Heyndrickxia sp.]
MAAWYLYQDYDLFYIVIQIASQWLNLTDERTLIFPIGFLLLITSVGVQKCATAG